MMDEEIFRRWAEIDETSVPGNPWGIMADIYHQETKAPIGKCVDVVVLHYLRFGNVQPLTSLLALGIAPGPNVLKCLAMMLEPVEGTEARLPYSLVPKRRDGAPGDYSDPSVDLRDRLIHLNALKKGAAKHGYRDRALEKVLGLFDEEHCPRFDTALKAYKKHSGKRSED